MVVLGELVTSIISINKHLTEHPNHRNLTKTTQKFLQDSQSSNYWEDKLSDLIWDQQTELNDTISKITAPQAQLFLTTVLKHDSQAGYSIAPKLVYNAHPNIDNSIITAAHEILHGTWADIYIGLTYNTVNLKAWADSYALKTLTQNIAKLGTSERTHVLNILKKTPNLQTVNHLLPTVANHTQISSMSDTAREHWEWSTASANKLSTLAYHQRNPKDSHLTPTQHLQQKLLTLRHYFDRDPQKLETQLDNYAKKVMRVDIRVHASTTEETLVLLSALHITKHVLHYDEATIHYVLEHTQKLGIESMASVLDEVTDGLVLLSH